MALAQRSGLRPATISAIESGQSRPHKSTKKRLADALNCSLEGLENALHVSRKQNTGESQVPLQLASREWSFLQDLDKDLKEGLAQALICDWTHHSTSLEGNTINAGDTLFVLQHGLVEILILVFSGIHRSWRLRRVKHGVSAFGQLLQPRPDLLL